MSKSGVNKIRYKEKFLQSSDLLKFLKDRKVILAYSGGPDSTFLLHMLLENNFNVELAYVNHMLRGEDSDKEVKFVKNIASTFNIKLHYIERDILSLSKEEKKGIEECAREVRYTFFESIPGIVATAHNLDDNVETFLFRLIRGTSLKGLSAISRARDKYIRPILHFSKSEILEYLTSEKIEYVEDKSNKSVDYTRNMIRLKIVPLMESINPLFKYKIENLIEDIKDIDYKGLTYDVEELKDLSPFDRRQSLSNIIGKEVSRNKILLAENLLNIDGSASVDISKDIILKKVYNKIYLDDKDNKEKSEKDQIKDIFIGDRVEFLQNVIETRVINREEYKLSEKGNNIFFIDKKKVDRGIKIRTRREGDYFYPETFSGKKKLKKYFIDKKIDRFSRDSIPIILIGEKIAWIVGIEKSAKFKISDDSKEIIEIKLIK